MKLKKLLEMISNIKNKFDISDVYICGGLVRDRIMGNIKNIEDIDLTTGDKTINYLSSELYNFLKKHYTVTQKVLEDHSSIYVGNTKLDFSSNFIVKDIKNILNKVGIKNPTALDCEVWSRDFTCNSLLLTLDLKQLIDITHKGLKDIEDKIIRCCLTPEITLTQNKNRVARAIYLSSKLGFDIDKSIIEFVKKNPESINISTKHSLNEKINLAFKKDPKRASDNITTMGLWKYITITKEIYPYYQKALKSDNNVNNDVFFKNYDYTGPGINPKLNISNYLINKYSIDFSSDEYLSENNILPAIDDSTVSNKPTQLGKNDKSIMLEETEDSFDTIQESNWIGGAGDQLQYNDFDDKPRSDLDYGRDYDEKTIMNPKDLKAKINEYVISGEVPLLGLPNGLNDQSELDAINTINLENPYYGISDFNNTIYNERPLI